MLYIMRHGKTDWNAMRKLQGRTDIPLNEEGRQMAEHARTEYADIHFDICYCSPLIRAKETAEIVLKGRNIPIITDDRLKEMSFGSYEGTANCITTPGCPIKDLFLDPANYKVPKDGGESFEQLFARTGEFLKEVVKPQLDEGKDVLIVYDDLSKHAVAYRALSLLLGRSPGREAYPGDVFYLHSRLLERSSRLSDEMGGGSITALPIIETQAGDVSAYIPTNVISITDVQIFLESDLFFSGMRPAVNVGLSVSRVGGAAQTKAMKKAAGSIRIDLAQYREMEVFTQFSSDLDAATKEQLEYGSGLMELLKQPLGHPMSMHEMVITLCAARNKVLLGIPVKEVKKFQMDMLNYFATVHPEISEEIEQTKALSDELAAKIVETAKEFKDSRC